MTLKQQVLDKLAKGYGRENWEHFKEQLVVCNAKLIFEDVEGAVVLALETKQAEVLKEIEILIHDPDFQEDMVLGELKKRLLAKKEAKKK